MAQQVGFVAPFGAKMNVPNMGQRIGQPEAGIVPVIGMRGARIAERHDGTQAFRHGYGLAFCVVAVVVAVGGFGFCAVRFLGSLGFVGLALVVLFSLGTWQTY